MRAALARDGSAALVYSPKGEPFSVCLAALTPPRLQVSWFDPRYGTRYPIHTASSRAYQTYTPPTRGDEHDWVLVLQGAD